MAEAQQAAAAKTVVLSAANKQLLDSFHGFMKIAGDAFKPAVDEAGRLGARVLSVASGAMPALGRASAATLSAVGKAFAGLQKRLAGPVEKSSAARVLTEIPKQTGIATSALGKFGGALLNVFAQAMPFVTGFVKGLDRLAGRFLKYTETAKGQKEITGFFKSAIPVFAALGRLMGAVFNPMISFGVHNAKGVADGMDAVTSGVKLLGDYLGPLLGATGALVGHFARLKGSARTTAIVLGAIGVAAAAITFFRPVIAGIAAVGLAVGQLYKHRKQIEEFFAPLRKALRHHPGDTELQKRLKDVWGQITRPPDYSKTKNLFGTVHNALVAAQGRQRSTEAPQGCVARHIQAAGLVEI